MSQLIKAAAVVSLWLFLVEPSVKRVLGAQYDMAKAHAARSVHHALGQLLAKPPRLTQQYAVTGSWGTDLSYTRKWSEGVKVPDNISAPRVRARIVETALAHVDVPYVLGGEDRTGVDCSGLVVVAYRAAGIEVPHKALLLFRHGEPTELAELELGDLLFFRGSSGPADHVGIYVGQGRVIHASSGRRRVIVEPLGHAAAAMGVTGARSFLSQ